MLIVIIFLVATALNDIFSVVAYRYARAMPITAPFEPEMLSKSFQARPSRFLRLLRRWWNRLTGKPDANNVGAKRIETETIETVAQKMETAQSDESRAGN